MVGAWNHCYDRDIFNSELDASSRKNFAFHCGIIMGGVSRRAWELMYYVREYVENILKWIRSTTENMPYMAIIQCYRQMHSGISMDVTANMESYQYHTIVALQRLSVGPRFIHTFLSVSMGKKCLKLILNNLFYQINQCSWFSSVFHHVPPYDLQ